MGVIGVAGVGVAGSCAESDGVAPVAGAPPFFTRYHQCQHFNKKKDKHSVFFTLDLASLASFLFFLGLALFPCWGVGGALAFCCGEGGCVRPLGTAPGAAGGGIGLCCGVP